MIESRALITIRVTTLLAGLLLTMAASSADAADSCSSEPST